MAQRSRPTSNKRDRERAKLEKRKEKAARRQRADAERSQVHRTPGGEDPDIAGIVPGPQPREWDVEDAESEA
jgi:hypothetical protein